MEARSFQKWPREQGSTKEQTILQLVRKAGVSDRSLRIEDLTNLEVVRYQSEGTETSV